MSPPAASAQTGGEQVRAVIFLLLQWAFFGGLLGTGGFLLHQQWSGWIGLSVLILSIWQLRRRVDAVPS